MITRWGRIVVKYKQDHKRFPPFAIFANFVSEEAKISCDPVTSLQSLHSNDSPSKGARHNGNSKGGSRTLGRSFLSESSQQEKSDSTNTTNLYLDTCQLCGSSHNLDVCTQFLTKSLSDRKSFIKGKKLCFACLGPDHISKYCKHRLKCSICAKHHPSSLHGDFNKSNMNTGNSPPKNQEKPKIHSSAASLNDSCSFSKCSMIVPVYVSHNDHPDIERLVYALLDTQSDTSFILEKTCKAIGIKGNQVQLSLSTMHAQDKVIRSQKVKGLSVRGIDSHIKIPIPVAFTRDLMPANRGHIPTPDIAKLWPHLEGIAKHLSPLRDCEIGLLIGYNCPRALLPREVIPCDGDGPYGERTDLSWGIVGVVDPSHCENDAIGTSHHLLSLQVPSSLSPRKNLNECSVVFSFRTTVKEVVASDVLNILESDFKDMSSPGSVMSYDDRKFLSILSDGIKGFEGRYELPLPFKYTDPILPDNKSIALSRLNSLKRKLLHDKSYCQHYVTFMKDLFRNGHAEKVPKSDLFPSDGHTWYIPHHGVYHPQNPGKIRVVFDGSSIFKGTSLNSHLLQGPDLTNKLLGVLDRFRKEPIAFTCDVEKMFYQFKVSAKHRNYLRFLWWENNDFNSPPTEYRMTVHLFGATSSPGCANFGFKRVADDNEAEFGSVAADFIRHNFYVDDGLRSVKSVSDAVQLIQTSKDMCKKAGIRLHKFQSNSRKILEQLDPADPAEDMKNVDLSCENLPVARALGVLWNIDSDHFSFAVKLQDRSLTRRGLLSTVSSVYDPFGFLSPVTLLGKQMLQQMCADQIDWDDPIPERLESKWNQWCSGLDRLSSLSIPRCVKPIDFGNIKVAEAHHFSDASTYGYGHCSYLRIMNKFGQVYCCLLLGKARVVPLKPVTVPRLELSAAVLSVKSSIFLDTELQFENLKHIFWTDSKVILGYIANDARRFHVFVANRVQQIRNSTDPSQWRYVASADNPADMASRGVSPEELTASKKWFKGPEFLWKVDPCQATQELYPLDPKDTEIKQVNSFSASSGEPVLPSLLERLQYFSSWFKARRAIATCRRYMNKLKDHSVKSPSKVHTLDYLRRVSIPKYKSVSVSEIKEAEHVIVKHVQSEAFGHELKILVTFGPVTDLHSRTQFAIRSKALRKYSHLHRLCPFTDKGGILRVGGRLQHASIPDCEKNPIILPRKGHVTYLILLHCHRQVQHQVRGMTVNQIRSNGYWIIGCSSAVSFLISKCVICRKVRGSLQYQKMADLPSDRSDTAPPFTYVGVDFFGPWSVREGRKDLKRYGVLFTCLSCRAIHVETASSLDTSSFINALRRFIAIRGPIRELRSDRGTNFVGAERELREAIAEFDDKLISEFLQERGCDLFEFKMNFPASSHMGGVWERQIRSVRNVLSSLLLNHGSQLDDEGLRTLLLETSAIVNSRPLTTDTLTDHSILPLSPNHLLTMKSSVILPPPGNFQKVDLYCQKRWRRVQYLANQFWKRWRLEYLQTLQTRKKWLAPQRNICVGDVVLLKEENLVRNQWQLGRIQEVFSDSDGLVRKVKVELASTDLNAKGERLSPVTVLERPVHKLVVLMETGEVPVREPNSM